VCCAETRVLGLYRQVKPHDPRSAFLDIILYHNVTDGQTDGQRPYLLHRLAELKTSTVAKYMQLKGRESL